MAFTEQQCQALKAKLRYRHVKTRVSHGATIAYVEGWHVIAEANRIFGYDAWDRTTLSPRCLWSEMQRGQLLCCYSTKVRITVRAGDTVTVREGIGTGDRPLVVTRSGARDGAQGRGNRRHQAGAGDLWQPVRARALRQGLEPRDAARQAGVDRRLARRDGDRAWARTQNRGRPRPALRECRRLRRRRAQGHRPPAHARRCLRLLGAKPRRVPRPAPDDRRARARIRSATIIATLKGKARALGWPPAEIAQCDKATEVPTPTRRKSGRRLPIRKTSGCAIRRTSLSSPANRVSFVDAGRRTPITCALRNRAPWGSRFQMSTSCRCATAITTNSTEPATNAPGGPVMASSSRSSMLHGFGRRRVGARLKMSRSRPKAHCDAETNSGLT